LDEPLSAYFRINDMSIGQFERTLIIVEKNSSIQYIEGCTAPIYVADSLHAAVVEIFIADKAKCRYITIQN
jgi:Fe-S cluster assembly protein SufB